MNHRPNLLSSEPLGKVQASLLQYQVDELNAIERDTDRPRSRIIRRAVEEYLLKYRQEHPEFATKNPRPDNVVIERELKKNIQTDIVIIRGVKREVVITEDGWRSLTDDDYEPERVSVPAMSVIDIPK